MTDTTTPRSFGAHVALRAEEATPVMRSGVYESVGEFYAAVGVPVDLGGRREEFAPSRGNEWLREGYAGAVVYGPGEGVSVAGFPFVLATYVEGDVTRYRFPRWGDAARAGRLWAAGLS